MNIFDRNIKKKLYNAEMPVSEGMWESIEAQIPVKQEKPKYWMFFLVTLFALPFVMYPLSKGKNQITEVSVNSENEKKNINITKSLSSERSSIIASTNSSQVTESELNKDAKSKDEENTQRGSFSKKISTSSDAKRKLQTAENQTIELNNLPLAFKNTYSPTKSTLTSFTELNEELSLSNSKKKLKFLKNPTTRSTNYQSSGSSNSFKLIEKSRIFQKANKLTNAANIENIFTSNISTLNYSRKEDIGRLLGLKKASPVCPSFETFRSGVYFYVDVRAGLVNQQLENKFNNQETETLIALRDGTESGALSTSFNFGIGKIWNNGVLLESGFNLDFLATNLKYNRPGMTVIVIDSLTMSRDTVTTSGQLVNSKNKFRQLNIPVKLGYEFHLNEKYSIATKAGVLVNLSSSNSGQIVDNTGLIAYDSAERINSLYKTNLDLSYTGGVDLLYEATQNISGYIGLNVNYYPKDFSLSTYAIKQSYYKYGMTAGLRYRL